ncbi:MAG: hypothetical protein J5767_15315 [Paludibacteraceae bacterium]|nr:hypothetical protein [Paludibacteraceae bacterium]
MGIGYTYKCKRCGRKYSVTVGMPYLYPQAYRELRQQIWEYRQGLQPARAFRLMPRAAVKAERIVLYCENEGHWLAGYDCTLYLPNDAESIPKDEVPFPDDLEKDYHVAWEYKHRCGICRKYMHTATDEELQHLQCPGCKMENEAIGTFNWD